MRLSLASSAVLCLGCLLHGGLASIGAQDASGEWRHVGGDSGYTHYSPVAQINKDNVQQLEVAWQWTSADAEVLAAHPQMEATNFECTPLMIGGVLYGTTPLGQAFALDAESGKELWTYNPETYDTSRRSRGGLTFINRGVAIWGEGRERRLFLGTSDARLLALDPLTGEPVGSFGNQGEVDTKVGIPRLVNKLQYTLSSAPAVCGDVVIVGARISDRPNRKSMPPGDVRGYDARTGKLRWTFHAVPHEGEEGNDTWGNDSWQYSGNTNVWSLISTDEELGHVYLPFGTPTNDFYGGERPGDNLYAESLVCLECATGKKVWHFQAIHHGLWDYDLPTPPILVDTKVAGRQRKVAVQLSKQGFAYVFDRVTGKPVWPIEERVVPQSKVPGEKASPTQPFPTNPPAFERQGITVDDLIDFTPELRAEALQILEQYEYGPIYTPPSLRGTLLMPSYGGGANWPGGAVDPETGILYVPSMTRLLLLKLIQPDPTRSDFDYVIKGGSVEGPRGLPLIKPPYGRLTAIDLNQPRILWQITNGGDGPKDHPALAGLDLPPLGSPTRASVIATKTLLFLADGSGRSGSAIGGGNRLRALDKASGEELWSVELDGQVTGVPMTYQRSGKQYLVAPVGSDPPQLVAFALPANRR